MAKTKTPQDELPAGDRSLEAMADLTEALEDCSDDLREHIEAMNRLADAIESSARSGLSRDTD